MDIASESGSSVMRPMFRDFYEDLVHRCCRRWSASQERRTVR